MSSRAEELAAKMREKQAEEDVGKAHMQSVVNQWPLDVTELFISLESWVGPLREAGLDVSTTQVTVSETPSGQSFRYTAPQLSFRYKAQSLTFTPKGRFVMGGTGRIEVTGMKGPDTALIRTSNDEKETWIIWTSAERGQRKQPELLTEDSFLSLVEKAFSL